ncbi:hypothetical protein DE146DRAFT_616474 [Phaeosphaeria sp. MPI-PUGE-AT-0046c]|nr:hypothetical protein DE146DRAFT_616474 [Phaeosphaeria sp. MPI-PUGE-AT-0046c]
MAVKVNGQAPKAEEAEVSHCVSNLIHAFANGLNIFKKLRERRRKRKARKDHQASDSAESDELQLSKSLKRGPQELADKYDACYTQSGHSFAKGDAIAHASLAETLIKLNTGLVAIIASFLNHDKRDGKSHLNIDYKSLTNLSDVSRREALQSMTQLYQRLSQSQLQLQQFKDPSCTNCGSTKHSDCSVRSSTTSGSSKEKKRHTSSRHRMIGPVVTRMPIKSSSQPQLVVVRPRPSRKNSSHSPASAKSQSPLSSAYTSPLASPLPLYVAEEPFEIETDGVIRGVLGGPVPLAGSGRRRKDSFNVHDPRPTTWPEPHPASYQYPYVMQEHLHLPTPKLPKFTSTPRKSTSPPPKTRIPPSKSEKRISPPPVTLPIRRRADKITPSSYTFASDSTKLGEIPQRHWTTPWDYAEADRLNNEAAATFQSIAPVIVDEKVGRKKGIFKWMKKGNGAGVPA